MHASSVCLLLLLALNAQATELSDLRHHAPITKPIFVDMACSNNAARIRLWRRLKLGAEEQIERCVVKYQDLKTPAFAALNPLMKVPAFIREDGETVFESYVILNYLEDKFSGLEPSFKPPTPEGRQQMELLIRIHDLYIASPNCCAPGFSHSQGSMYLSFGWHGAARGMDLKTREAKVGEIWKQLNWLETQVAKAQANAAGGLYMLGDLLTLADFTWFPTCVFMEFMLPRVFGWHDPFAVGGGTPFPALAKWFTMLHETHAPFAETRQDIIAHFAEMEGKGQFKCILDEIAQSEAHGDTYKFQYGVPQTTPLNYQASPPPGKTTGRYINQPDKGDVSDEHVAVPVNMHDARELSPSATLESMGFELLSCPTAVSDFADEGEVVAKYYGEMEGLVKEATGASKVHIFDHTVRESGNTNLNAQQGGSAAPVPRVHCDYTATGAPRRLEQLLKDGGGAGGGGSESHDAFFAGLSEDEKAKLLDGRFAFINVWRSICDEHPVLQKPLAVCDENTVPESDRFLYELRFPDRTGENYSLKPSELHKWYYYPEMVKDECLLFKVYDKKADGPRFVFHTAFDDPSTKVGAPPRRSIEVRAIAFYD